MKNARTLGILTLLSVAISCQTPAAQEATETTDSTATEAAAQEPVLDVAATVAQIDSLRMAIESNLGTPLEVSTAGLRAKISQKWEKIHFYTNEAGEVVRIKTYPYSNSRRTEEFYLQNGAVVLAVVEDDGSGPKGKATDQMDKMYYFHQNEVIHEVRKTEEAEHGVRNSDGEELLAEAKEYLEILAQQNK